MAQLIPVTLVGENLAQRHHYYNKLVEKAYRDNVPFEEICDLPEQASIDRLLKIDLASKHRKLDFIIDNLKHEDALYVSRSLKCYWMLNIEYAHIINPKYLEEELYPNMKRTAANKMKHWIYSNLRDQDRCQEFYKYYAKINLNMAVKYLINCSEDFVCSEYENIKEELNLNSLTAIIKKFPKVTLIYFQNVGVDVIITQKYLQNEKLILKSLTNILRKDGDLVLNIIEKFHTKDLGTINISLSRKILKQFKSRVIDKFELYASQIFSTKVIAEYLTPEESLKLLERLARAEYIQSWFTYKNVEPLIKLLSPKDRTVVRKRLFVNKEFGDVVKDWQYTIPSKPTIPSDKHKPVFIDMEFQLNTIDFGFRKKCLKKRKYMKWSNARCVKTNLDRLFDEYRFTSFNKTLFELMGKLKAESNMKNRLDMMLVLISKCGKDENKINKVMSLLATKFYNEPANVRASVIRSFVKRGCIWRANDETWKMVIRFGKDLGLTSATTEANCSEGIHAAVIRHLFKAEPITEVLKNNFLKEYSTLIEYDLDISEKICIEEKLPKFLLDDISYDDAGYMNILRFLDTIDAYKINIKDFPEAVLTIVKFCHEKPEYSNVLLSKLYSRRALRKDLIAEYFKINQNDESYFNALKYDPSLLENGKILSAYLKDSPKPCPEKFLRNLILFFGEKGGLAERHFNELKENIDQRNVVRPLLMLCNGDRADLMEKIKETENKDFKQVFEANKHLVMSEIYSDKKWNSELTANQLIVSKPNYFAKYLLEIIKFRKLAKSAFTLSGGSEKEEFVFNEISKTWPKLAFKIGISHIRKRGKDLNIAIWNILSSLLDNAETTNIMKIKFAEKAADFIKFIPLTIKADVLAVAYNISVANNLTFSDTFLIHLANTIPGPKDSYISTIAKDFIEKQLILKNLDDDNYSQLYMYNIVMHIAAKLLILCKTEIDQTNQLNNIGAPLLQTIAKIWTEAREQNSHAIITKVKDILSVYLKSLKSNEVVFNEYASPIPVYCAIQDWMKGTMNEEANLADQIHVCLTILYYKSLKESKDDAPEIFEDENKKRTLGLPKFGHVFGRYIAQECNNLILKYYRSVIYIFKNALMLYLEENLPNELKFVEFVTSLAKGILEDSNGESRVLAAFIYNKKLKYLDDCRVKELFDVMKTSDINEIRFLVNTSIC